MDQLALQQVWPSPRVAQELQETFYRQLIVKLRGTQVVSELCWVGVQ